MKPFASLLALAATSSAMELMDQYDSSISVSNIVDDMQGDISSLTRKQVASVASLLMSLSSSAEAGPFEVLKLE